MEGFLKLAKYVLLMILTMLLMACGGSGSGEAKQQSPSGPYLFTVEKSQHTQQLPYVGSVAPIKTNSVFSPVDGRVQQLFFNYGSLVKNKQKIVEISSTKLEDDFRQAVSDFISKKSAYENALADYQGSKALRQAGVISQQDYLSSRSSYQTSLLSFYASKFQLEKILKEVGLNPKEIENVTAAGTEALNQRLRGTFTHIDVTANMTGIALLPSSSSSGSGDSSGGDNKQLVVGQDVKQGQLLLTIGDLSGISADVQVSEIEINEIKKDLPVVVTSDAFPGITLHGYVSQVAYQATSSGDNSGSGLSTFDVSIVVPKLTLSQQKVIHVGMTIKAVILIKSPPTIMVPINAVITKDGKDMVYVIKDGQKQLVPVQVGNTTLNMINVVSGLNGGEQIWVPNLLPGMSLPPNAQLVNPKKDKK